MCKHVAAVLYGVGARLDEKPQLLFVLRDVDENEMLASAGQDFPLTRAAPGAAKVLDESDVAALFGLEMAETPHTPNPAFTVPKATPTVQGAKRKQDICQKDEASSEDRCRLTSCDSGQFRNEKDNPSKCQETAHSGATLVFQGRYRDPMARNARTDPVDEFRLSGLERKCCEHVGEDPELALS